MPRRLPEELEGKDLVPICMASKLGDAKKVESVFDEANIDYTFEITPIIGKSIMSILFGGAKNGVMFLVSSEQYDFCRSLLENAGFPELIIG
ncbi:MAG: hypothetical protein A2Y97_04850 [Nitrospirae bacterium RBG_13_39_12]|nr:MAG: hypothetical protein A2Y97_04850 [Nitrospirae bacterium RBG_13_39_12]